MDSDEALSNVVPMQVDGDVGVAAHPLPPVLMEDEAHSAALPRHVDGGPQFIPPLSISLDEVSAKLYELQMELSLRTLDLANVRAKYDRAMVEGARQAAEIAQLRVALQKQRDLYSHLKGAHNRLLEHFTAVVRDGNQSPPGN